MNAVASYFHVLLIDDQEAQMQDFKLAARGENIRVTGFDNYVEGFDHLQKNIGKYDAVILDALCLMEPGQAAGTESQKALRAGINRLNEMKYRDNVVIPFCVYTGHFDRVNDAIEDEIKVFVKGKERERMFDFLKSQIANKDEAKIVAKYSDVFELFELGYLPVADKSELLNILKLAQNATPMEIKNTLRGLRPMMEAALKKINETEPRILPNNYRRGNSMSLGDSIWHLAGRPKYSKALGRYDFSEPRHMPLHIFHLSICIKDVIAATSLHHSDQELSKYAQESLIQALLDFLHWFKGLIDQVHKGEIRFQRPRRQQEDRRH